MRRGDVYLVDLDPARGSEANKLRPAVIVSNDAANRIAERTGRGIITIVPVTSNIERIFPFQVPLRPSECGLKAASKAQAEQVRSISLDRLQRRIGTVPGPTLHLLDNALRLHLSL
jgi:mRNA interferase MazF